MEIFILFGILIAMLFISLDIKKTKSILYNTPMGVSQWENHGRKYGYWDYFKKATQDANHVTK